MTPDLMTPHTAHLLESLGWAVIHSLWQGAFAALAVAAFRALTKDSQAALRYGFQVIALVGCFLAFCITFSLYHMSADAHTAGTVIAPRGAVETLSVFFGMAPTPPTGTGAPLPPSTWLATYTPALGLLWCLGFVGLTLRYTGGFIMTQTLRTQGLSEPDARWVRRFRTLVLNAGVRKEIKLYLSDRVAGPLTLGFFKPFVLVPTGFFAGLPPDQVEAILLHEIAHVRRHDYLINLAQTLIRTVLFYHPAVHYISRHIDDDREHACDDIAVALTQDPQALVKGLAALRLQSNTVPFALAADNGNTPLVARLKRLAGLSDVKNKPSHIIAGLTALTLAGGTYAAVSPASAHPHPPVPSEPALAGAPQAPKAPTLEPGLYVNGTPVELPEALTDALESLGEALEEKLEEIEGQTDTATDIFDDLAADLSEIYNPDDLEARMEEHREDLEKALQEADQAKEKVLRQFERQTDRLVKEALKSEHIAQQARREAEHLRSQAEKEAERALRRAERQAERTQKQAIKAAERRIKAQKHRQVVRDSQARRQQYVRQLQLQNEMQQRNQELQVELDAKRLQVETRQAAREKARVRANAKQSLYFGYSEKLRQRLKADGLIARISGKTTLTWPDGHLHVNGIKVSHVSEKPYCDMLHDFGLQKNERTRLEIAPGLFDYTHKDGSHTRQITLHDDKGGKRTNLSPIRRDYPPVSTPPLPGQDIHKINFVPPTSFSNITQTYGYKIKKNGHGHLHRGIDIASPAHTPIIAPADGIVSFAGPDGHYGNTVRIRHSDGYETTYAHMAEICVEVGQTVEQKDWIGTVGSTGKSTGPHLHFEVRKNGLTQDPQALIRGA